MKMVAFAQRLKECITEQEKREGIHDIVHQAQPFFDRRTDQVVAAVLKNKSFFYDIVAVLQIADGLGYHQNSLTSLRIKVWDVLVGGLRDFPAIENTKTQLQSDQQAGIIFSLHDTIIYYTNLFLYGCLYHLHAPETLQWGEKTERLLEKEEGLEAEKLRLVANFIQYYSLTGQLDQVPAYIKKGEAYFPLSSSLAYQALYILATATYLNEWGKFEQTVQLLQSHQDLIQAQEDYPSMRFFALTQLSEAFLKLGETAQASPLLQQAEAAGRAFFKDEENSFFARLFLLKAFTQLDDPTCQEETQQLLKKALTIYQKIYGKETLHKNLGSVHLMLGKYCLRYHSPEKAEAHFLQSQHIFNHTLKGPTAEVRELHQLLRTLNL